MTAKGHDVPFKGFEAMITTRRRRSSPQNPYRISLKGNEAMTACLPVIVPGGAR